ncbi:MAG: DUF6152 family protein [Steroidobacteraceae bacterium]
MTTFSHGVHAWTGSLRGQVRRLSLLLGLLMAMPVVPALAHHSFAPFDQSKTVAYKGTVSEFQWTNPHSWLIVKVKGEQGDEVWSFEMLSPNVLRRMGWRNDILKPGDVITVTANPARDGSKAGLVVDVLGPDGKSIGGVAR